VPVVVISKVTFNIFGTRMVTNLRTWTFYSVVKYTLLCAYVCTHIIYLHNLMYYAVICIIALISILYLTLLRFHSRKKNSMVVYM